MKTSPIRTGLLVLTLLSPNGCGDGGGGSGDTGSGGGGQTGTGVLSRSESNPVLEPGNPGAWDDESVEAPSVLYDGSLYHLWYAGTGSSSDGGIGYAFSSDGVQWTRHPSNPVLSPSPGAWDEDSVNDPCVIFDGATFWMYYVGEDASSNERIGVALSGDGVTWTRPAGNPVLLPSPGEWDEREVGSPSVLREEGLFRMWYSAETLPDAKRIGYAESPDGLVWTKSASNPVLGPDASRAYQEESVEAPTVMRDGTMLRMFYAAEDLQFQPMIGEAVSADGISWTRSASNPVLTWGELEDFDNMAVTSPSVLRASGTLRLYYSGEGLFNEERIGFAMGP